MEFKWFDDYQRYLLQNAGKPIILNIIRAGRPLNIEVIPTAKGKLEVGRKYSEIFEYKTINFGFFESFPAGIKKGVSTIKDYLKQFRLLFSKDTKAYESLGGFITIGKIFPGVWNWEAFWNLTALLSVILAVMNILPIPALDGGHVMFLLFEVVTGRKPSDKFLEYAQIAGMVILISLLLFANGNDIIKLFRN
jgi:regulator of sigma E protease